jgi:hypothetical protein
MKWIRVFCLLGWIAAGVQAADATRPAPRRFLLIVETSSASTKCSTAVESAVRQLVGGAFDGKMKPGDTLGVWTYQDTLDVGFPMHFWKPSAAWPLSEAIVEHLRKRRWDQPPIWENVLTPLRRVADVSDDLTVAVITSPGSRLSMGAELDARIGAVYAEAEAGLRRSKLPFVTFFAIRNGKLVDAAVNSGIGPWTIPDPPVPPRPQPEPAREASVPVKLAPRRLSTQDTMPVLFASSNASQVLAAVAAAPPIRRADDTVAEPKVVEPAKIAPPVVLPKSEPPVAVIPTATPKTVSPDPAVLPTPAPPNRVPVAAVVTETAKVLPLAAPKIPSPEVAVRVEAVAPGPATAVATVAPKPRPAAPRPATIVASVEDSGKVYLALGLGLSVLAVAALWRLLKRGRRVSMPSSLITQSLDRR